MKTHARSVRVAGHIQRVLSEVLRKKIKDPRLEGATITGVKVSTDLRQARVYYSLHGGPQAQQQAQEGFASAAGYVKRSLAGRLGLRYMPDIRFHYDESFDYGERIERIFQTIHAENGSDRIVSE
jgi:ribosome-binding factor A